MDTIARLNEFMKDRELTLTDISERSGVSKSTLVTAQRRNTQLSIETVERICVGALQIPLYEFFATDEDWKELDSYISNRRKRYEPKWPSTFSS